TFSVSSEDEHEGHRRIDRGIRREFPPAYRRERRRRAVAPVHEQSPANQSSTRPSAAGGTLRPTSPASAMIVSTYGIIETNWLGIACRLWSWICSVSAAAEKRQGVAGRPRAPPPQI